MYTHQQTGVFPVPGVTSVVAVLFMVVLPCNGVIVQVINLLLTPIDVMLVRPKQNKQHVCTPTMHVTHTTLLPLLLPGAHIHVSWWLANVCASHTVTITVHSSMCHT